MRPHLVIMPSPRLDHGLGLSPRAEPLQRQALVAEFAVEALRQAILPGFAGIDQCRFDALPKDPFEQRTGDELRPVIGTKIKRCAALATRAGRIPRSHGRNECARPPRSPGPPSSTRRSPSDTSTADRWRRRRTRSRRTIPGWLLSAFWASDGRLQCASSAAFSAPEAWPVATAGGPGRSSSCAHHGRGRSRFCGSRSADTAPTAPPCA